MRKNYIDWSPGSDPYLREGEQKLHEALHQIKFESRDLTCRDDRLAFIAHGEKMLGLPIAGTVLDVGAGNGYASVFIAQQREIKQVHSLECDLPAVDNLIRTNYRLARIPEEKYELILGSYNDIRHKSYYDFVVSLGAIHHSSNLLQTMKQIYDTLKPGGCFIAHEPYSNNDVQNQFFIDKESKMKKVQGLIDIKEGDRDDHFFRECEYLTAFYHCGFEVHYEQVEALASGTNTAVFALRKPLQEPSHIPHQWK